MLFWFVCLVCLPPNSPVLMLFFFSSLLYLWLRKHTHLDPLLLACPLWNSLPAVSHSKISSPAPMLPRLPSSLNYRCSLNIVYLSISMSDPLSVYLYGTFSSLSLSLSLSLQFLSSSFLSSFVSVFLSANVLVIH